MSCLMVCESPSSIMGMLRCPDAVFKAAKPLEIIAYETNIYLSILDKSIRETISFPCNYNCKLVFRDNLSYHKMLKYHGRQ